MEDESRVEILENDGCARCQIRFHVTRSRLHESPKLLLPMHPSQHTLASIELGLCFCESAFLHGSPFFSPLGRCLVTRKHSLHRTKPAFQVALLKCLQHSSGEKAHRVCQTRINRPRTQVIDRVAEQFGNVVHGLQRASDILGDPRCVHWTFSPATALAELSRLVGICMKVAEAAFHSPSRARRTASSNAFAALSSDSHSFVGLGLKRHVSF